MASYGVLYRVEFDDVDNVKWRIDICQKDLSDLTTPYMLETAAEPLRIEKSNNDESIFTPILKTNYIITYMVTDDPACPTPETFIYIENDTFLVNSYKDGQLEWKGFISPDNNTYPWVITPFTFQITATDFSFSESDPIDLNDPTLFLYGHITLGDFFKRTLFHSIGYDDPVLKILYSLKPDTIGAGKITDSLYLHTDAFYSFTDGPRFSFDCLTQWLRSTRARMFFSAGSYWLQYFEDIGSPDQQIITITPGDTSGVISTNVDTVVSLGNGVFDEIVYKDQTQEIQIAKALKQQVFNYQLKPINAIKNFDWRTQTQSPFTDWEGGNSHFYQRIGTGSADDMFSLHIEDYPSGVFDSIWSRIAVLPNQLVEVEFKINSFLTLSSPTPGVTYSIYLKAVVVLVKAGEIGPRRWLGQDGKWNVITDGSVGEAEYYHIEAKPTGEVGTLSVTSDPVPTIAGVDNLEILIVIVDTNITPGPPSGSTYFTELAPVFGRIYNDPYTSFREKIVNAPKYSYVADDDDSLFFMDIGDISYSNTIFYDDDGTKKALPLEDWDGDSIDQFAVKLAADMQARPAIGVMGDFLSTKINFHHGVTLSDKADMLMMQVRDKYSVKSGVHSLLLAELIPKGSATSQYSVTKLTEND